MKKRLKIIQKDYIGQDVIIRDVIIVRLKLMRWKMMEQDFKFGEPEYLENNPEYEGDLIDQAEYARGDR